VRKQIDDDLKRGFNFQSIVNKYAQNPVAGVQSGESEFALEGPCPKRLKDNSSSACAVSSKTPSRSR